MSKAIPILIVFIVCLTLFSISPATFAQPAQTINTPVLKWSKAGCLSGIWCDTGWYSSPAVADLDNDGKPEVIWTDYKIHVINGEDGTEQWSINNPGGGRGWASVVVGDVDNNGSPEIVTAHSGGYVQITNADGTVYPNWPKQPTAGNELRSLAVDDVDKNGELEILVCSTRSDNQWFLYDHNGNVLPGFPVHSPDSDANGYAAGCYNENVGLADLDGDHRDEMIGPNDTHYVVGYHDDGTPLRANAMYGQLNGQNKVWARVGFHYDQAVDLRGYANCTAGQPPLEPRPNFADTAPSFADVNGDGVLEIIFIGNEYDCRTSPYTDLYHTPYIVNLDRTRWSGNGFDWTNLPVPDASAAPLSEDYNTIENVMPNPVVVDLDNDGYKEILYSSYDGRLHAYWLDKTEHGNWPYKIKKNTESFIRFSSEPAVVDLDNDGQAEVIVATWTQKGSNTAGQLLILSSTGTLLQSVNLPRSSEDWDGSLSAPTVANIDDDPDLEVVVGTAHTGLVAYDLPGTANARVLWGTGRGNYLRTGQTPASSIPLGTATPTHTPTLTPVPTPTFTPTVCAGAPGTPILKKPKNGKLFSTRQVTLVWTVVGCATHYQVQVQRGSTQGPVADAQSNLGFPTYTTKALRRNRTYYWHSRACNGTDCSTWSNARSFKIAAP